MARAIREAAGDDRISRVRAKGTPEDDEDFPELEVDYGGGVDDDLGVTDTIPDGDMELEHFLDGELDAGFQDPLASREACAPEAPLDEVPQGRRSEVRSRIDPRSDGAEAPREERMRISTIDAVGTATIAPPASEAPLSEQEKARRLVEQIRVCAPGDEAAVVQRLTKMPAAALPALLQEFPGVAWFNRHLPHRKPPKGRDVSPIGRAIVAFGEDAVPYVASLLDANHPDDRYLAALIAADIGSSDLVGSLGPLLFDEDAGVREIALHALTQFDAPEAIAILCSRLRSTATSSAAYVDQRILAVRAMGVLRDEACLPVLAELLDSEAALADTVHKVLALLTAQDLGSSPKKWLAWIDKHGDKARTEWLIAGLDAPTAQLCSIAARELVRFTGEDYGYDPDASRRDRRAIQKRYQKWWKATR